MIDADSFAYKNNEDYLKIKSMLSGKVNALKNIQLKIVGIEEKFYEELHQLECKYAKFYEPLFEQREKIISGEYEPTAEEGVWALDTTDLTADAKEEKDDSGNGNEIKDLIKGMQSKIDLSSDKLDEITGIPLFWLQTFKRTDLIMDMIQEHDEDVLYYLKDIKVIMHDKKPYGYTLEFHFNENEYFTNKVLTKSYELTCESNQKDPFAYDGPVMYKCKGCIIDWNKGKDVTMRTIKKKQKHKSSGTIRVILKEEKQDSFFNYFDTPTADGLRPSYRSVLSPNDAANMEVDEEDEEIGEDLCNADFEIGHFIKEYIVPKAVLYYTGELIDQASFNAEDQLEDFFQDEDENDTFDYDEDDQEEAEPKKLNNNNNNNKSKNKSINKSKQQQP